MIERLKELIVRNILFYFRLVVSGDCDTDNVQNIVQSVCSNAQLMRHYGKEMSFLLPSDSTESFPTLFLNLDDHMNAEGNSTIEGYGISMTTLEEVCGKSLTLSCGSYLFNQL